MSAHHAVRGPFEGASTGGGTTSGAGNSAGDQHGSGGEPKWWASDDLKKRQTAGKGGTGTGGGPAAVGTRGGQGPGPSYNPTASFTSPPYPIQPSQNPPPPRHFGTSFVDQGFVPTGLYLSPNASTFTPLGPTTLTPLGPLPLQSAASGSGHPSAPPSSGFYVNHEEYRDHEEDLHAQPDGSYADFPTPQLAHKVVLSWSASQGGSTSGGDAHGEPQGMLSAEEKERIFAEARQKKGSRAVEIKRPPAKVQSAAPASDRLAVPPPIEKRSASPAPSNTSSSFTFSPQVADFRPRKSISDAASTGGPVLSAADATALPTDPPLTSPPSTANSVLAPPVFGLLKSLKAPASSTVSVADSSITSLVPYGDSDEGSGSESDSSDYATPPTVSKTPTSARAASPAPHKELQRSSAPSPSSTAAGEAEQVPTPDEDAQSQQVEASEADRDYSAEAQSEPSAPTMYSEEEEDEAANTTEELIVIAEVKVEADGASPTTSASKMSASSDEPPTKRVKTEQAEASSPLETLASKVVKEETPTVFAWSSADIEVRPDALVHADRANAPFSPSPIGKTDPWERFPSFNLGSSPFTRSPLNPAVSPFNPTSATAFVPGLAWSNGSFSLPPQFGPAPPPNAQQEIRTRTLEGLLRDTTEENGVLRRKVEKYKVAHKEQADKLADKDAEVDAARKELVEKLAKAAAQADEVRRPYPSFGSVPPFHTQETQRILLEQRKALLAERDEAVKQVQRLLEGETKRARSLEDAVRMRDDKLRAKDDALRTLDDKIKNSDQRVDKAVRDARVTEKQYREECQRRVRAEEAERCREIETRMVVEKKALEAKIKVLEDKLKVAEADLSQATTSVELMKGKTDDATGELKALSAELKEMVAARDCAVADAKKIKDELSLALASIIDWKRLADEKAIKIKALSTELQEMVAARDAALARLRHVENERDMRLRELEEARTASKQAQEAETQTSLSLASIKTALKEKEDELAKTQQQRDEAIREIIALENAVAVPTDELIAAHKACDGLRAANAELETRAASLDKELTALKAESEAFRNKALKEIKRLTTQVKESQEQLAKSREAETAESAAHQARVSKLERDVADALQKAEGAEIAKKQVVLELDETKKKLKAELSARSALEGLFRQKNEYKDAELKMVQERAQVDQGELRQRIRRLEEELVKTVRMRDEAGQHLDAVLAESIALKSDNERLERRIAELDQRKSEDAPKPSVAEASAAIEKRSEAASQAASTSSVVHAAFARKPVTSKTLELLSKSRKA